MAATWTTKITVLDLASKTARVDCTRTDPAATPPYEKTFTIDSAVLATVAQRNAIPDQIKTLYLASVAATALAAQITAFEASWSTALNAMEPM